MEREIDARSVLAELAATFPAFEAHWRDEENLFREEDGSFTSHGVFCDFADFYRERHASFSGEQLAALGGLIARHRNDPESDIGNAAAVCFLENIAGDPCERVLAPHLDEAGRELLRAWGGLQGE